MYGEWIKLSLGEEFTVRVWIATTPDAPYAVKRDQAWRKLQRVLAAPREG